MIVDESAHRTIHNVHSPIQKLPYDTLYIIFSDCKNGSPQFAFTASHVCRHWRRIVLAMSALWSNISFPATLKKCKDPWSRQLTTIARSGSSPLEIMFQEWKGFECFWAPERLFGQQSIPRARGIMAILTPHSSRWRSLKFKSSMDVKVAKLLVDQMRDMPLPELATFELKITGNCKGWGGLPTKGWTSLRHLKLGNVPFHFDSEFLSGLRTLDLLDGRLFKVGGCLEHVVRFLLKRAPHLTELYMVGDADGFPYRKLGLPSVQDCPSTATAGNLEALYFGYGVNMSKELISTITAPRLKRLYAPGLLCPPPPIASTCFPLLHRFQPFPSAEELYFIKPVSERVEVDMEQFLAGYPRLKVLHLRGFLDDALEISIFGRICPLLQELCLRNDPRGAYWKLQHIKESLQLRNNNANLRPLLKLDLSSCRVLWDEDAHKWLQGAPQLEYFPPGQRYRVVE